MSSTRELTRLERPVEGLHATPPTALSFAPSIHVRAFVLERGEGNLVVYNAPGLAAAAPEIERLGGIAKHFLNHSHEAMFGPQGIDAPLFVHERDRLTTDASMHVRATFARRHRIGEDFEVIPTPGHTPGATSYLWDTGQHRFLFTGDSLYLRDGEWRVALLDSSDREAYLQSLAVIRELDFDVLVPWAATAGTPYVAVTSRAQARRRIDAISERVRRGEDR